MCFLVFTLFWNAYTKEKTSTTFNKYKCRTVNNKNSYNSDYNEANEGAVTT